MNKYLLYLSLLFALVISLQMISADIYSDCSIYGNCVKPIGGVVNNFNNNTAFVNNSNFLQGYTWSNAPYPAALYSTFNSTYASLISMDYAYVNLNILGNITLLYQNITLYTNTNILNNKTDLYKNLTSFITTNDAGNLSLVYTQINNNISSLNTSVLSNVTSSFVPYVGANNNVNLSKFNLSLQNIFIGGSILGIGNFSNSGNGDSVFGWINATMANTSVSVSSSFPGNFIFATININSENNSVIYSPTTGAGNKILVDSTIKNVGINNKITINGGSGSFVGGQVFMSGTGSGSQNNSFSMSSTGIGSFVWGRIAQVGSFNVGSNENASISATSEGDAAIGVAKGGKIVAGGGGNFAQGLVRSQNSLIQAGNLAAAQGDFAQGAISGGVNGKSNTIIANNGGDFAQGFMAGGTSENNSINATGSGSFAQGIIQTNSNNAYILSSGAGSFAHGSVTSNNFIVASGTGAVAIGLPNLTISGTGSIGLGQNLNITGNNAFAFGAGNRLASYTSNSQFTIDSADFYINGSTTPNIYLGATKYASIKADGTDLILQSNLVGSGRLQTKGSFNMSNILFGNLTNVGINMSNPLYTLDIQGSLDSQTYNINGTIGITKQVYINTTCYLNFTGGLLTAQANC